MNRKYILFLLLIISVSSYGQITFEKGYYIDNSDQRTNCLIKNIDWKNNPTQFEYRLSDSGEIKIGAIKSVKEFGVGSVSKYIRSTVNIDRSTNNIYKLSNDRRSIFKKETMFLKVLVEGNANLYLYREGNLGRYFYNKQNTDIEQLIYKKYQTSNNEIGKNERFKNQLWNDLQCSTFKKGKVKHLRYIKKDLINYFVQYNVCTNEEYVNYEDKQKRDVFNLSFRPGINNSKLSIQNIASSVLSADFDNELAFRFGVEAEFIMPFNKNKWALIIEPTYQSFTSEIALINQNVTVDYTSIELPIGIRHYFFFNENSKIFINGLFVTDLDLNSKIDFELSEDIELRTTNNLAFGLGYTYNNRYSVEVRYQTKRQILSNFAFWNSDYQTFSVILGYSIF